jgi:TetR/AcrR family transcriptional repressor of nem operon
MTARVTTHRERLLHEGALQIYARGFHGTTVDAILEASGVPKGSFYHHFGSKEAFAGELLRDYTASRIELFDQWSERDGLSTSQVLSGYFRELADMVVKSAFRRTCLVGKLTVELAAANDRFHERLSADIGAWRSQIRALLEKGQLRGDVRTDRTADALADTALALIQGAFVVVLASRDAASLDSVCDALQMMVIAPGWPQPA